MEITQPAAAATSRVMRAMSQSASASLLVVPVVLFPNATDGVGGVGATAGSKRRYRALSDVLIKGAIVGKQAAMMPTAICTIDRSARGKLESSPLVP